MGRKPENKKPANEKQQITLTFQSVIKEVFEEMITYNDTVSSSSITRLIENLVADKLKQVLLGYVDPPLLASCKNSAELACLWVGIQKANRKVRGFKMFSASQNDAAFIHSVQGPTDPVLETGEIVSYPVRMGKINARQEGS